MHDDCFVAAEALPGDWRLFAPRLDDGGRAYVALRSALGLPWEQAAAALERLAATSPGDGATLRIRASALLLHDLVQLGWEYRLDGHWIQVRPPRTNSSKEAIRRQLEFARADQLREAATKRFLMGLERPARSSGCLPVTELIADGRRLAAQLAPIASLPRAERAQALSLICQPYLQLVDPTSRDVHSGIRLMDLWRYFRHTWLTRYRSSPGRNLFYLVRDAAQPKHPIMAITALGNAVMQLTPRDDSLGWSTKGLTDIIRKGIATEEEILVALRTRLVEDISQIYLDDLPLASSLSFPVSDETLDRLQRIEEQATSHRMEALRAGDQDAAAARRIEDVKAADLESLARSSLFRAKRARAIRDLLRAQRELELAKSVTRTLTTPEGEWAVGLALRQLKKRFSATSMMELTVCGAVPPYNHLLAGKLACLLMTSPRVRADYAQRYNTAPSIIASQMAGRVIAKPTNLVFLGTTSLFTQRSSQYNRVVLPMGSVVGQRCGISYEDLGVSVGFGSPSLRAETEAALKKLGEASRDYRNVNFVFGEGQSPKLRQLREGLDALGLAHADVLNHGTPRIVYGVKLAENTERVLLGVDSGVDYCILSTENADDQIASFWISRWLASRLDHAPALSELAQSSPLGERVSRFIGEDHRNDLLPLLQPLAPEALTHMSPSPEEDERLTFIRQLYRDESAYSDHVKLSRLRSLNVRTRLDEVVRRIVRAGGSVVITGNASDGKTHTIRLLESDLKSAKARVIVDASELAQEQVAQSWAEAKLNGEPFCIAINEGLLIDLIRTFRSVYPWLDEIQRQLLGASDLVSVDEPDDDEAGRFQPEPGAAVVLDLSLRRILAPDLVSRIVDKLTDDAWYAGCTACLAQHACAVSYNRKMLRHERVKQRLSSLLDRVAERGVRATFREVLAFISFLIFGGKSCSELRSAGSSDFARYYWNAFEGQGSIFEQLGVGLDPVRQTDARVDENLWRGEYAAHDFVGHELFPVVTRNLDEVQRHEVTQAEEGFVALKRRWYFEHPTGRLVHTSQADKLFQDLQDPETSTQLRVGRLIGLINGRWNRSDRDRQDGLRLWTRLSFSPRAKGRAMVSGREVSNLSLKLFKPRLAPALRAAFGPQAVDHLVLAPPDNVRFASLVVDRRLLIALLASGITEQDEKVERRLTQFNDALAQHAQTISHVRTIELLDLDTELSVRVRVDLGHRRYDSAQ
ncbi:MAG: DUF4338 domain-containing protein [Geminicoccaceae bacterium]